MVEGIFTEVRQVQHEYMAPSFTDSHMREACQGTAKEHGS